MATRESTLQQSFDPIAFHSSAAMSQRGWAEREVLLRKSGVQHTITRFSSSLTFFMGLLLVLALRPINVMDTRDVVVSSLAVGLCWVTGLVVTKILMTAMATTLEIDRVVTWSVALGVGLLLSATGSVADLSRDVDDYIAEVPGYALTSSPEMKAELEAKRGTVHSEMFSDVGIWTLHHDLKMVGALSVFLVADTGAESHDAKNFFSRAVNVSAEGIRRDRMAGESIFVSHSNGQVHVGWMDGSALVVTSGKSRALVDPVARSLLKKG